MRNGSKVDARALSQLIERIYEVALSGGESGLVEVLQIALGSGLAEELERGLAGSARGFGDPRSGAAKIIGRLAPHCRRALEISRRLNALEAERALMAAYLDLSEEAAILIDERGRVLRTNVSADRLLSRGDGLERDGPGIRASARAMNDVLRRVLARMASDLAMRSEALRLERPSGRPPLSVVVVPLRAGARCKPPPLGAVAVLVRDPGHVVKPAPDVLRHMYGLSPAEARLAALIVDGITPKEAARDLGVSVRTVRNQLQQIFRKTGTNRQTALVQVVLSSLPPLFRNGG